MLVDEIDARGMLHQRDAILIDSLAIKALGSERHSTQTSTPADAETEYMPETQTDRSR